jgi:hypothetical protein
MAKKPAAADTAPEKKKAPAAAAAAPKKDPFASGLDPKREGVFIREFAAVKDAETEMAELKGKMSGVYKRLESAGFTKDHITFAKSLEKKNVAEVIADFTMKIAICRIVGHAAGRQLDMLDKDRTPIEDQAYYDGYAAGRMGRGPTNPYGMETMAGQRFQAGMNEGNAERNKIINEAVNGPEIIKGASADDGGEGGEGSGTGGGEADQTGPEETGGGISTGEDRGEADDVEADGDDDDDGEVNAAGDDDDWDRAAPANQMPA